MKITGRINTMLLLLFLAALLFFIDQQGKRELKKITSEGSIEAEMTLEPVTMEKEITKEAEKKPAPKIEQKENVTPERRKKEKNAAPWVKIIYYHEIFPEAYLKSSDPKLNRFTKASDRLLIVTAENFEKQMEFLSANYMVIRFSDFAKRLESKQPYEQNAVIITFDGADETIFKFAYPVLKKYKIPATLFLYVNSVKLDKTAMKWDTIKLLHEEGLIEFESHSISHPHMNRKLNNETEEAYEARIRKELVDSRKIIEQKLNKTVRYFAYPYGGYNDTVIRLLKETGYKASVTVQQDKNTVYSNPYNLKRRGVLNNFTLKRFEEIFTANIKDDPREYAD